MAQKQPTYGNGKICYIEIPSDNIALSSSFYQKVFGWEIRTRDDGTATFNDTVGEVNGTWALNREPHTGNGLLIYIMVYNLKATQEAVISHGGKVIPAKEDGDKDRITHFSDPYGNIFGLYQQD